MTNERLFFFEQTDFSLRFARCVISDTSLSIEELKEVPVSDTEVLGQLAPAGTAVVCALRPKPRQLRLTNREEGLLFSGVAGLRHFARLPEFAPAEPAWFAARQAADGAAPAGTPSLVALCSAAAHQQAREVFETIKLKPARCLDATLASVGALATSASGTFLLLEIGELASHTLLIGNGNVLAARKVGLNLDQIAEAVRLELGLKFRGAAAKLFFNPDCDFSEAGQKVAGRIADVLKPELAQLLAGQPAPLALCCTGLPAAQHWFEIELGKALGLALHEPDGKAWSASVGLTFGSPALAANIGPAWFNFLHFINAQTLEAPEGVAWQAEWVSLGEAPATPPAKPALAPEPSAAVPRPTAPVTPKPAAPAPTAKPAAVTTKSSAVTPPTVAKPAQQPSPKPAAPPSPAPAKGPAASLHYSTAPETPERSASRSKRPLYVGLGILALALLGGYLYLDSHNAELARVALEKKQTEQRLKAEEEKTRLAEQQAHAEAESRKKFEFETSRKLELAEAARKQAETEARNQAAVRLANARGTLVVTTEPAGAMVAVGDLPPKPSPVTFALIKIGKYPVTLTLAHHEEVKLEAEVTENNTTETGPITLPSLVGSATLTSEPAGSAYEIHPANAFSIGSDAPRTGLTPATVADLDPGEYTVTFSRPGWAPHSASLTVSRGETAQGTWTFPAGTVRLSSVPAGATVLRDGLKLGRTPLTLLQPPGPGRYELQLAQYEPLTLAGQIEEGKTTDLTAELHPADLLYGAADLDSPPEPINPKIPDLPDSLTLTEGKVVVQMTINRDGTPTDLKIIRASNPNIGKIYLAALAKWKFKPGMKAGKPVRSVVVAPFLIQATRD